MSSGGFIWCICGWLTHMASVAVVSSQGGHVKDLVKEGKWSRDVLVRWECTLVLSDPLSAVPPVDPHSDA